MNSVIKKTLIIVAILALMALLIKAFEANFEYIEKTQWQPLNGEAKTNPLYASQLFLRRMGIPTQTIDSLEDLNDLPDTDTVILISSSRQSLRTPQLSDLVGWVSNGGHLIISGVADWNIFSAEAPLVDEPEKTEPNAEYPVYYDEPDEKALEPTFSADPLQEFLEIQISEGITFDDGEPEIINLRGSDRPLELGPDYYQSITLNDDDKTTGLEQIAINGDNLIIRQQIDEGLITVVSDLDFISNLKLGKFDHAEILWQLVHGKPATRSAGRLAQSSVLQPRAVWLIHSDDTANLLQLIWKHFWALVVTSALLFLIWILRVSRRFGPLVPKQTEDRRNLLEHIDASGTYYWQQHQQDVLLESTRGAAQQQLAKRIPGWNALPQQEQIQLLTKRFDMAESLLIKTLYGNIISTSPHEFTEIIKQLEHIRTRL